MANINREESSVGINYFEHNVEKKPDGTTKLQRLGIVLLNIFLAVLLLAILPKEMLLIAFCGFALVFAIITYFLYKRTEIEYEYVISSGDFTMSKIYGRRSRKDLFTHKVSAFNVICPYTKEAFDEATRGQATKVYKCISSPDALDIYMATFVTEKGEHKTVLFEAPKKAISVLKFYNSKSLRLK